MNECRGVDRFYGYGSLRQRLNSDRSLRLAVTTLVIRRFEIPLQKQLN